MAEVNKADLVNIIIENCPTVTIKEAQYQTDLSDLGVDSLDMSAVLLAIEEKYDVKISDEEGQHLNTIDAIAGFISK